MASVEALYFSTIVQGEKPFSMVLTANGEKLPFQAAKLSESVVFQGDEKTPNIASLRQGQHLRLEYEVKPNPVSDKIGPEIMIYSISLVRAVASV